MKTEMAWTSLLAYESMKRSGTASEQQLEILKHVINHPGVTRDDISEATGIKLQSVCGAVNPLVKKKLLKIDGADISSGHWRTLVWPVGPGEVIEEDPSQMGLF